MIPILYHPGYDVTAYGLERFHPFDGRKYRRIHHALISRGCREGRDFIQPQPAQTSDLLKLHTTQYLDSLGQPAVLAGILELPVVRYLPAWLSDRRILRPMRHATGGTMLACRAALDRGIAINLGGGYHHAAATWGGGFCAYADVPLAVKILRDEGKVQRVLVVDLDAHQGNGTASVFKDWDWASIYDLYEHSNFPDFKEPEDFPLAVASGIGGEDYLHMVKESLPGALDAVRPDLVVYNAGSDPFVDDPLAGYNLSESDLVQRDMLVVKSVRDRSIPLAMVLSGGYSRMSWKIHADSIQNILKAYDMEGR